MFKFLKEKLSSWAKKLSGAGKKTEEVKEEAPKKIIAKPEREEKGFFERISARLSKVKISEKEFEVYGEDLRILLLENNVAYEVAEKIIAELKKRIIGKELLKKEIEEEIRGGLREIILGILIEP